MALASIALGVLGHLVMRRSAPPEVRARWAQMAGRHAEAEGVWWGELQRGNVTVPVVIEFLAEHRVATVMASFTEKVLDKHEKVKEQLPEGHPKVKAPKRPKIEPQRPIPEADVEAFFRRPELPREIALVYQLQQGEDDKAMAEIEDLAARKPPVPWMNHVLAVNATRKAKFLDAANYYEREAVAFGRADDLELSLHLREQSGDEQGVLQRLNDPALAPLTPPSLQFHLAMERHDYRRALRWLLPYAYPKPRLGPLLLAVVAAFGWGAFCMRLGQVRRDPRARVPLYAAAFGLGLLSIAPTMFLIVWQDSVLHLREDGTLIKDLAHFILGVGFREELSKLLLFLPLLPLLHRRNQLVEVVTCGALVGLGFAAVENLEYFSRDDLAEAIGRFMTANFLHMGMTAITTTAVYRMLRTPDGFHAFTVSFLTVVALHGIYDFLIVSPSLGGDMSYFAMTVFVFVARDFVVEMHNARLRAGQSKPLLPLFAVGTTLVCGSTFVYASVVVGPGSAAELMFAGLLGVAILTIVFVRQLRVL